jgi:hypothetical protein
MRKPFFLVSSHASERRGLPENKCLNELKHSSKEISPELATLLLGRRPDTPKVFPKSRFWVSGNEYMYITTRGRSPNVEIATTCIHLFDEKRQDILREK